MTSKPRPSFPARLDRAPGPVPARGAAMQPMSAAKPAQAAAKPVVRQQPHGLGLDSHAVRQAMVNKLAGQGISDVRVLSAMGTIERHRFVAFVIGAV